MKTKNLHLVLINALIATVLFYNSSLGINCLIFALWNVSLLSFQDKISKTNWVHLSLFVLTAVSIFYAPQLLSIALFFVHLFIIIGSQQTKIRASLYQFLQGIIDSITWLKVANVEPVQKEEKQNIKIEKFIPYVIAIPLIGLFFFLYSNGNPLVDFYTSKIDLSFIEFGSIVFFLLMIYLSFPLLNGGKKIWFDRSISTSTFILNQNQPVSSIEMKSFKVILISLSSLLAIVHLIDFSTLITLSLPAGITYSQFVNQGFWTLVISIILSVILVLYFFRGQLNFESNKKEFITLATIWLALNLILVISTGLKNSIYVYEYGLTYKRIAVFFFLITSIALMSICLVKVRQGLKMDIFISRGFNAILIICTAFVMIHWDTAITRFNLSDYTKNHDTTYLMTLKNNRQILLRDAHLSSVDKMRYEYSNPEKWNETTLKTLLNH